ncbi:MAG: preprotein translocase subunit SecE, partial [bacterium]
MQKIIRFINEVRQEISKVIWPSREELYGSVVVVIILCVLLSLFLFVAD